jgi:two-component system response regulator DevR
MADPADPSIDLQDLLRYSGQVHALLKPWQIVVATAHRPFANMLLLQMIDRQPVHPLLPQRLLAIGDSAAAVRQHLPDAASDVLVLMDETLRDGSVLPLVQELLQRPSPPTILLAMAAPLQPALVRAAWRLGVQALVALDDYGKGELAGALAALNRGERYCGPSLAPLLTSDGPADDALSRRELEVLPLLAEGCTNRQIAQRLQIAEVTARDHVQRILQKLQVKDRSAAAALAVRLGLVR